MAKPSVTVRLPGGRVVAGTPATLAVTVNFPDETKVNRITARFAYLHHWSAGRMGRDLEHPEPAAWELAQGQTFPAGSSLTQHLTIHLPATAPPSHYLGGASSRARLVIHVDIPWALDVRSTFELPVVPPAQEIAGLPHLMRSDPDDPRGVLEVSLASQTLIAGTPLVGKVALYGVEGDREVRISAMALLTLIESSGHVALEDHNAATWEATVAVPADKIGREVPFAIALPRDIVPSFIGPTHSLRWILVAQTGGMFSRREVRVPLLVVPDTVDVAHPVTAPPVGDDRVLALFGAHARESRWSTVLAPAPAEHRGTLGIERAIDDCVMRIAYDNRGTDGRFVRCSLAYPPLGLGLVVKPASFARHAFFHDIEVAIAAFDQSHHVVAHDAAQAVPYLRAGLAGLGDTSAAGTLEQWTDTSISWSQSATNLELQLPKLINLLEHIAPALVAAAAAVPPPLDVTVPLDRWRALADSYRAHLVVGDLSIRPIPRGQPVSVTVVRDTRRRPTGVRVSWGDTEMAPADVRAIDVRLARATPFALPEGVPAPLADFLRTTGKDLIDFTLAGGVASATLPMGEQMAIDIGRVRELVDVLRAAIASVTPQTGPFR